MSKGKCRAAGSGGKWQGLQDALAEEQPAPGAHPHLVGPEQCHIPAHLAFAIERMRGGGHSLDWKTRTRMGAALGCDFRHVRVHTGAEAERLNYLLGARAIATGRDIFFAQDAYDPSSDAGRELIAHELVHIVQQATAKTAGTAQPLVVRPACDVFEQEAEALAPLVAGTAECLGQPRVRMTLSSGSVLQRALAQTVTAHNVIGVNQWWRDPRYLPPNPPPPPNVIVAAVPTACHFATVYWLFLDEFNRTHTQEEVVKMGNAQLIVARMIAHGTRKNSPMFGSLTLTVGSLLLFVDAGNQPVHSCVAVTAQSLGGYNQLGCFSQGGTNHAYSVHPTSQLVWGNLANRNEVRRPLVQAWYKLLEVPEGIAKALVRQAVQ